MDEKALAKKLDDIFSDNRINHVQLAHVTARTMNGETNAMLDSWYAWHIDLVRLREEYQYPGQEIFDLGYFA